MSTNEAKSITYSTGATTPYRFNTYGFVLRDKVYYFQQFTVLEGSVTVQETSQDQPALFDLPGPTGSIFAKFKFPIISSFETGFTTGPGNLLLTGPNLSIIGAYFKTEFIDAVINDTFAFQTSLREALNKITVEEIESATGRTGVTPVSQWLSISTTSPSIATITLNSLTLAESQIVSKQNTVATGYTLISPDESLVLSARLILSESDGDERLEATLFEPAAFVPNKRATPIKTFSIVSPSDMLFGFVRYWPKKSLTSDLNIVNGANTLPHNVQILSTGFDVYMVWNFSSPLNSGLIPFLFMAGDLGSVNHELVNPDSGGHSVEFPQQTPRFTYILECQGTFGNQRFLEGNPENGSVQLKETLFGSSGTTWVAQETTDGFYFHSSGSGTGKYLTATASRQVALGENRSPSALWLMVPSGSSTFAMFNPNTGLYLNGDPANGTLVLSDTTEATGTKWRFLVPVAPQS